jgi:type IV secretion/conjugal transfer VirB4 family ATPase
MTAVSMGTALHREVPLMGFLSEAEFLTKSGDVGTVLVSTPRDAECCEPKELDRVVERLAKGFRILGDEFRLYQYLLRRRGLKLGVSDTGIQAVDESSRRRAELLSGLYQNDYYIILLRIVNPKDIEPSLFPAKTYTRVATNLSERRIDLSQKIGAWREYCADFWTMRPASKQEAFLLFRRLMNFDEDKITLRQLNGDAFLDYRVAESPISRHGGCLVFGPQAFEGVGKYVDMLSLRDLPKETTAHMLGRIQGVEAEYNLALSMNPLGIKEQRSRIKRAKGSQGLAEQTIYSRFSHKDQPAKERRLDQGAVSNVEELGDAERQIEGQDYLGLMSMQMAVYGDTADDAERSSKLVSGILQGADCQMQREGLNLKSSFFSMIPGGYRSDFRQLAVLNTNASCFSLCFGVDRGNPVNEHLGRESLITVETSEHTPYFINLHQPDVAHGMALGRSGAGKSFLLAALISALQKYDPYTLIFDMGGGFEWLTNLYGGCYTQVQFQSSNVKINPFSAPGSRSQYNFLTLLVSVLIEQRGDRMTAEDEDDLFQYIVKHYEDETRSLGRLAAMLPERLSRPLRRWVYPGQYHWLFDHEEDNVSLANFQTFDFAGMEKYPDILEPLFLYVFHRADGMVHDPERGTKLKGFFADEAWVFLKNARVAKYLMEALKTWRKRNAFVFLSTQSATELENSEIWEVIAESCATQFFLWNPGMDDDDYKLRFHLNSKEIAAIRNLVPKRDFLFKTPFTSKVLSLRVDEASRWIYVNDPVNNEKRKRTMEAYGENWLKNLVSGDSLGSDGNGNGHSANGGNGGSRHRDDLLPGEGVNDDSATGIRKD